jgi:DNA polymerase III epsilon subunit-like protein
VTGGFRPELALATLTSGVRFVVLDTETTPSEGGNRILSLGAVQVDGRGGTELGPEVYWLCNPGRRVENSYIHSLTDADVVDEQPFSTHLDELDMLLTPTLQEEQVVLVCHNASWDIGVLQLEHKRAGRLLADVPVLDTRQLARHLKIGPDRLSELLAHFGHQMMRPHHALSDAQDTALLLKHLLEEAAGSGEVELEAFLAAVQGEHLRTSDYAAHADNRGTRERRSPFIFIERPRGHSTHKRLPHDPSEAQLSGWLDELRGCIRLRCPFLSNLVFELRGGNARPERARILEALMQELEAQAASADRVGVNTTLSLLGEVAREQVRVDEVPPFYDRVVAVVGTSPLRCDAGASVPFDACPECRAGRACAADVWFQPLAVALTGLRLGPQHIQPWLGGGGKIAEQAAAGRTNLAAHAAWLVVNAAGRARRLGDADALAALALDELGLIEPRLIHYRARRLIEAGELDLEQAMELVVARLSACDGSSDLAWRELERFRTGLVARQQALQRVRTERPFLFGRSAPAVRPQRRRFTNITQAP